MLLVIYIYLKIICYEKKIFFFILLLSTHISEPLHANDIEFLQDTNLLDTNKDTLVAFSNSRFSETLDLLNYTDNFAETKLKSTTTKTISITHRFDNSLRIALQYTNSTTELTRVLHPNKLETVSDSLLLSASYPILISGSKNYDLEVYAQEDRQQPLKIDCYQFGSEIIGGSCNEASIRFFDSEIYKQTGEKVFKPVMQIEGNSEAYGLTLRIIDTDDQKFRLHHSFSLSRTKLQVTYVSDILDTTDPFLLGSLVGGSTIESIINAFKQDIPQTSPWYENKFKYALSAFYQINKELYLTSRFSLIKTSRSNYLSHPLKTDFNSNKLLDLGLFYSLSERIGVYGRLALSSNYLLGINSLSYNRKTNHLFDHPYGEVYIGLLINF